MLKLRYLSHSCFYLSDGLHNLIIDPFLTGNPNAPVKADEIKVEYIVLTHGHGDHIGDSFSIAKNNNSTLVAVNELANFAAEQGINTHNMHLGGAWNFPFGRLKFTIAHHGSTSNSGRSFGAAAGVVLKIGGKTVYHAGDTALFLDMKLIGELDKIDVFCCPIGDNFTMGIDDAVRAVDFVQPELVIPMHYNTFPVIEVNPNEFKSKVEAIGKKCKVMEFGETIEL